MSSGKYIAAGLAALVLIVVSPAVPATAGCNSGSTPDSALLSSDDCKGTATGTGATAVGKAAALADYATAVGASAHASDQWATALGYQARAQGVGSTALGEWAFAFENYTTTVGGAAGLEGATSIGYRADGGGAYAVAVGANARSPGDHSVAIGGGVDFPNAAAFSSGAASIAIGLYSNVGASDAIAIGRKANIPNTTPTGAIAIGALTGISQPNSVAIGSKARATQANAVAIGANSVADAANTVSVGSRSARRRITNVANAVNATDAVNLAQVKALMRTGRADPVVAGGGNTLQMAAYAGTVAGKNGALTSQGQGSGASGAGETHDRDRPHDEVAEGCTDGDMAGNWSLVTNGADGTGAATVLWCDVNLTKSARAMRYHVNGQCRGHSPHESTAENYELSGNDSLWVGKACKLNGSFAIRQAGGASASVSIIEGRVQAAPEIKSRALLVSRWPSGKDFALRTMVMAR